MTEQEIAKLREDISKWVSDGAIQYSHLKETLIKSAELCTEAINMKIHLQRETK